MRKLLPAILALLFAFNVSGQTSHFKQIQKKAAGTVKHSLNFTPVTTQKSLQAAQSGNFKSLTFEKSVAADKTVVVRKGNNPIFIEKKNTPLKSAASITHEERFFRFLEESKGITGIDKPRETYKIIEKHTDKLGITHIRSVQQYKGIEIYGSQSTWHLDAKKERYTGSFVRIHEDIAVNPAFESKAALQTVIEDLKRKTGVRDLSAEEKKIMQYDSPVYSLVIFDQGGNEYVLTWEISIRPNFIEEWKYFVDASTGKILRSYNNTKSDGPVTASAIDLNNVSRNFNAYLEQGNYYLINLAEQMFDPQTEEGYIMTLDANNTSTNDLNYSMISCTDNAWSQKQAAVSAHYNAKLAYDYFLNTFGRNSLNGSGGNIISFINLAETDGSSMENAFWSGFAIFYGNGGSHFKPLAGALDVAAHEMGHGVISNSANLEYLDQPGAINETYADIFGSMVDRQDWLIGEDVVKPAYYPSGALRSMADPHNQGDQNDNYWQPAHTSEMYLGNLDNGGVHINSGIGNHAFYLFATAVGKDKAEQVFYRALTEYLTKTSQFIDFRIAVIEAAKDLHGSSSNEAVQAAIAFSAVGIHGDDPVDNNENYTPNPGQERLLIYNTDDNYSPTLYTSPESGNTYEPLSSIIMKGKVSVTDDGTAAVYVSSDSRIYVISLDPDNPSETPLSDQQFFDNVAVSKDGMRVAAISTEVDASIYVYDFGTNEWQQFTLYNPTTNDEINAGGVLYADAIEFDHTGEYLIYDAYNELSSTTSEDISYWDVGFIKVWDNHAETFGDGTILKLFTSLPENVSIGNPVFSKNSSNIIAFDYFYSDGVNEVFEIYGANLETGEIGLITENSSLGYPSFSKNDDRIAFTYAADAFEDDVYTIGLAADKIHSSGSASLLMEYAKWPVYYATGSRILGHAPVANFTADYKTGSAPLVVKFVDLSDNEPTAWAWTFQGGTPATSAVQNPQVTYNALGTYKVTLKATNEIGNNTLTREGYIVVGDATGNGDIQSDILMFYPNPAREILNITCSHDFSVRIFNETGKLVLTAKNEHQINLSSLRTGLYIMEINTKSGITRHKLMKE